MQKNSNCGYVNAEGMIKKLRTLPDRYRDGKPTRLRGFQPYFCPFTVNYPEIFPLCAR